MSSLSIKEIKTLLDKAGISYVGCSEKSELVRTLLPLTTYQAPTLR